MDSDLPTSTVEKHIWNNWDLSIKKPNMAPSTRNGNVDSPDSWEAPPCDSFKLNFDGAWKGNPGEAGFGGVFRDSHGKTVHIYFGNIGWDRNNTAELEGLLHRIHISKDINIFPLEEEGDSRVVINMAILILHGSNMSKVFSSWSLDVGIRMLANELRDINATTFLHVRRKANALEYYLANKGMTSDLNFHLFPYENINENDLYSSCTQVAH